MKRIQEIIRLLELYYYSLFKKFITKSMITGFSFGLDSAIKSVNAANVLLSITCLPFFI